MEQYIKELESKIKIAHTTISQLIEGNKLSPSYYIDLGNNSKDTIGNIKVMLSNK